ncbi:MAG: glutamine amidotransferase [Dehalococcoidia bacterium]|nr:glutamine amidotransferase [Dehalococcoidia bacterium]
MILNIAHLYAREMNLYGDRGNIICLTERCRRRGIEAQVREVNLGEPLNPEAYDLIFMGGGQDKEQRQVAQDLQAVKGEALKEAVENGVVALAVCGGYQLMGLYYRPAEGPELPGLGIFDAWTVHPGIRSPRCIGNLVARWQGGPLVGFENHGGRTYLGDGVSPLATVVHGHGNNSEDGTEGAVYKNAFGTYLHGSFLPKNPHFADHLIYLALARKYPDVSLAPLDDAYEWEAHEAAVRLAAPARGLSRLIDMWR